jgi:hypothetical protein
MRHSNISVPRIVFSGFEVLARDAAAQVCAAAVTKGFPGSESMGDFDTASSVFLHPFTPPSASEDQTLGRQQPAREPSSRLLWLGEAVN